MLVTDLGIFQSELSQKQQEVEKLSKKLVMFETFKHKYDVKVRETERLLHRVEELSKVNGDL